MTQTTATDITSVPVHGAGTRLGVYIARHGQAFARSLGEIVRAPFASLLTILAIAITLCLPAVLYLTMQNMADLAGGWDKGAQVSLFLHKEVTEDQVKALTDKLGQDKTIKAVNVISPAQALEEFKRYSEFSDVVEAIGANPLPITVVIQPVSTDPDKAKAVLDQLATLPEVERSQLDLGWLQRLHGLIAIGEQALLFLAALFGVAVMLIVGNMIRLLMQQRREEIEIIKLVGGSNAFIRRPFLYRGMLFGLLGGLTAWGLVGALVVQLQPEVAHLARLYQSKLELSQLYPEAIGVLLGIPALLGWLGAYLTVGRYLAAAEPR